VREPGKPLIEPLAWRQPVDANSAPSTHHAAIIDQIGRVHQHADAASRVCQRIETPPVAGPVLGWRRTFDEDDEVVLEPPTGSPEDASRLT